MKTNQAPSYLRMALILSAFGILAGCVGAKTKPVEEVVVVVPPTLDADGDGVFDNLDNCPNTRSGALVDANGCEIVVRFPEAFFAFDSARLTSEATPALNEAAALIADLNLTNLEIAGHTDSVGPESYNKKLGYERASSVLQYFIDQGLNPAAFNLVSYGESNPIANNDSREGRAQNRRVELVNLDN